MRTSTGITIDADRARSTLDVLRERIPAEHEGAQLYVSLHGETVIDDAVGTAREDVPLTPDHRMLWFSASKPATAVAIARLWESGELALDDPVSRFIPEFACNGKERATIRHLLTHTGGFRKVPGAIRFLPWEEMVRDVCEAQAEWEPGTFAGYHPASSWVALGEIVRRIDGRRIDDYLREEIFTPLGMTSSSLGIAPGAQETLGTAIAHVYPKNPEPTYQVGAWNTTKGVASISPGGSCRGPAHDLGRFYECLLRGGDPLLRPQTVEALTATHRVNRFDHTFQLPTPWGLGFVRYGMLPQGAFGGVRTYGHGGHSSSVAIADPDAGLVFVCITNGLPGAVEHHRRMMAVFRPVWDALEGLPPYEQGDAPGPITLGTTA